MWNPLLCLQLSRWTWKFNFSPLRTISAHYYFSITSLDLKVSVAEPNTWRSVVQRRIDSKTRRFSKRPSQSEAVLSLNRFGNVAGCFFYPLMRLCNRCASLSCLTFLLVALLIALFLLLSCLSIFCLYICCSSIEGLARWTWHGNYQAKFWYWLIFCLLVKKWLLVQSVTH